jgi:hypothetical protein
MSKIDYEKIRQANIKEYGEGTRHLSYFADIYSTRTHFIFEVLQNAEDALSRRELSNISGYVHFDLHSDKLEIKHNRKPFNERNVIGICGIGEGTGAGDYTQIGKFGIGFKSVYAYSFFPEIHSENEHFKIARFVEPHAIEAITSKDTLIVLPFDQPENRPEWAFRDNVNADSAVLEISLAISKLNIRTLLFLQHIETIEWTLPNEKGFLTRKTKSKNKKYNWRIVEVNDHLGKTEQWQIFAKEIDVIEGDKKHPAKIEIAFLLEKGKVVKANDTELVISFPTEKKTELGFLIQAPFKATKSRDNIKSDDAVNHQIINTAAQLVTDSLLILRDSKKLNVSSYNALPLNEENFPENSFFRPVYDQVRETLKTQALLPAHNGIFIKANEAKLARIQPLVDLFSPKQLGALFNKKQLFWLDSSITEGGIYKDIYDYLKHLVSDIEVSVDNKLTSKLTAEFFSKQSLNWLIQFILYAEQGAKVLRSLPFVRLQSGKQVGTVRSEPTKPTAWIAPDDIDKLYLDNWSNVVHIKLSSNELIKKFLIKEDIPVIKIEHIVVNRILPKYKDSPDFDTDDYSKDLQKIAKAYVNGNDHTKEWLEKNLNETAWLACIKFGGNETEIFWKKPKSEVFGKPTDIEMPSSIAEDSQVYFLHSIFEHELLNQYQSFKKFLADKCVHPMGAAAIVEKFILPKYPPETFNESEYRSDLQWILKVPHAVRYSSTKWLACVHASGSMPDKVVWKSLYNHTCIYERNNNHEIWFNGLKHIDVHFLHTLIENTLIEQLNVLVEPIKVLTKNLNLSDSNTVTLSDSFGKHKQGLKGFHPDAEIIGLREALTDWNIDRCRVIWKILLQAPRIIRGETQFAKNRNDLNAAKKELEYTETGKLLRHSEYKWLPDKQGNWHKPRELLLTDLPDEFETSSYKAIEVAEKLHMKKPEAEKAADELAKGNPEKKKLLEFISNASDEELAKFDKLIPKTIPPIPAPSFKKGINSLSRQQRGSISSTDIDNSDDSLDYPERYQNNLNQKVEENKKQHEATTQTTRFSLLNLSSSNKEARDFLYEQYQGQCQITGDTFPKASANANGEAENYFEACSLLSHGNADYLNNEGNMLCVSADTMAKLKTASFEWLDDLEIIIDNFEPRATGEMDTVAVKIRLAGEECQITWSERHFARLVALWNKA